MNNEKHMIHVQSAGNMNNTIRKSSFQLLPIAESAEKVTNLKNEFDRIDIHKINLITYSQAKQLIKKLNITSLPFQQTYTYEYLDSIINKKSINHLPLTFHQNLIFQNQNKNIYQYSNQDFIIERLKQGLRFNVNKCAQILQLDLFEFIALCYQQQDKHLKQQSFIFQNNLQYNSDQLQQINQPNFDKIYFHRYVYESTQRSLYTKMFGWGDINSLRGFPNLSTKEYYHRLQQNHQYQRLAAIACCHMDFQEALRAIEQTNSTLIVPLRAMFHLCSILEKNESQDLTKFVKFNTHSHNIINDNFDQKYINQFIEAKSLVYCNIPNENLRELIIKNSLDFIRQQFKQQLDDPYLQLICNFFSMDDFSFKKYIKSSSCNIHFYDHLCLALRFLDNYDLNEFIQMNKSLDSIIIKGKSQEIITILQDYIDNTNDIQIIGIISAHLFLLDYPQKDKLAFFYQKYRDYLNQNMLFQERYQIEQQINEIESKLNNVSLLLFLDDKLQRSTEITFICNECTQICSTICQTCQIRQPHCALCNQYVDSKFIQCQTCKHGGHYQHIIDWFAEYKQCPSQYCQCECQFI